MKKSGVMHVVSILGFFVFGAFALATSHIPSVWAGDFRMLLPPNHGHGGAEIVEFRGSDTDIELPSHVQDRDVIAIASDVFADRGLTSVIIPNSIKRIEARTFAGNQLTSIVIPQSVWWIGREAFAENRLTTVVVPDTVVYLGDLAFGEAEVLFPDGTQAAGTEEGFRWSRRREEASITGFSGSDTVIRIPQWIQGKPVTEIGERAFESRNLTSVTLPPTLRHIGHYAFAENALSCITIPQGVTFIGRRAFRSNRLTNVSLPSSVGTLGWGAFEDNPRISVNREREETPP